MIEPWPARELPLARAVRGLCVGGWWVDLAVEATSGIAETLSGHAMRLAEKLVAGAVGSPSADVRVATLAPSGRPVAAVRGLSRVPTVSTSHVSGLVGAAVSVDAAVGLDLVEPADAGRGLDLFFSPDELALLPDECGLLRALLWAAKEAAFKAARLDIVFRPLDVEIQSLSVNDFTWTVRGLHRVVRGAGRFAAASGSVVAIAATARDGRDAKANPEKVAVYRRSQPLQRTAADSIHGLPCS
jgi:hypothetical protein